MLDIVGFLFLLNVSDTDLSMCCLYRGLYYAHGTTTIHLMNVYVYVDTMGCVVHIVVDTGASM